MQFSEMIRSFWRWASESVVALVIFVIIIRTFVFGLYHVPTGSAEFTILVGDRIYGNKLAYRFGSIKRGDLVIFDNPEFRFDDNSALNRVWQRYIGLPILGFPSGPDAWVKRVIAVPGDTIEGRIENGRPVVYRNGKVLDEPYVNPYPLIAARRTVGFIDAPGLETVPLLSVLQKVEKRWLFYTYDPSLDMKDQPFYSLSPDDLMTEPVTGSPLFREPYRAEEIDSFPEIRLPEGKYWVMGDSRRNSKDSRVWNFLDESLISGRASFVVLSVDSEEPWFFFELIKHPIDFWFKSLRWSRFFKILR